MSSSVPSVEDITNAFPTPITSITGESNYESLETLNDKLKANVASIPTTLGGGNHGYLGLILLPAAYATITATQFVEPIYPGQHPNVPAGTSTANTSTIVCRHTEDLRQWHEFKNVNTALKKQLLSTLDNIYFRALKDHHVGYMNQSIRSMLQHLFDNYGNITPLELEDNDTKMRATWDPNSPFDCLIKEVEDGQDYADDGGQPHTAEQLLCIAYTLVFKTGLFFEDCKAWNARPAAALTWDNFKAHLQTAQHLLCDQMRTTKQAGFHGNIAQHQQLPTTQPPAEYQEALINLASSAAADRELLTKLSTSVAAINQHINKLNHQPIQPPPLVQTDNDANTTSTALSAVTTSITELQQQLKELKKENASLHNSRQRRPRLRRDNGHYCWTHGYCVGNKHTSATYQNKAPVHQDQATHDNIMCGSLANKPDHLRHSGRSVLPSKDKINLRFTNTLFPTSPTAIADTGTTGHFLCNLPNWRPLQPTPPLTVKLPDGHHINSTGTTSIDWPNLPPTARTTHVLPQLIPHSLISIGVLCNHDCIAMFDKESVQIHHHNTPILKGHHLPNSLWSLPLYSHQPQANALFPEQTQGDLVQWLHAAAFSPSISTFLEATERNVFVT